MANVTATTGIDIFNGTSGTTSGTDEILVTNQNQIQSGDLFNGGGGTDTLRFGTALDFTSIVNGASSGIRNIEIIRWNGAFNVTFRSDQFGAGLLASNLTLRGANGVQSITINMVAGGSTFDMSAWQFTNWTGGTDRIIVNGGSGNDTVFFSSQHTIFDGGAGIDTLNYSNWGGGFTLTLSGSTPATAQWNSGLFDTISNTENIIGSAGDDTITGDGLDNFLGGAAGNDILNGGLGNDTLDGGAGSDVMTGGVGSDTFFVDNTSDVVIERATDTGIDIVFSTVTFSAAGTNQDGIEDIALTGTADINATGNALDNVLTGNSGNNVLDGGDGADQLFGNDGSDTLIGGNGNDVLDGGAGADTMTGGAGDDIYLVDDAGDVVVELSSDADTDLVISSVTFSAAGASQSGIENITLTGSANIDATGNGLNNELTGNSGNNVLDGGLGADTMIGGAGADTYVVDNISDVVIELSSDAGTDLVTSSVTFSAAGANQSGIENITLTGSADINATGNGLDNILTGNAGNNILTGGAGNDTYFVQNAGDVVIELDTDAGTDVVISSVTFSAAGANQSGIENITLTGTANINATGNALANVLTGNSGDNILNGGLGSDTMIGGAGSDTYFVDNIGDVVVELAGDTGTDLVFSSVSFSAIGANQSGIENITLTGLSAINATGNALNNVLSGNGAANVLSGGDGNDTLIGGLGDDTLSGGVGADVFVYDLNDPGGAQLDIVMDFNRAEGDKISFGINGPASFEAAYGWLLRSNITGDTVINGQINSATQRMILNGVAVNTLTASDFIFDTSTAPRIINGGAANDILFGGLGDDIITGGAGTGTNLLIGDAGNDILIGGDGADALDGGLGIDHMTGGLGNDSYYVDNVSDVVNEINPNEGRDRIYTTVSYSMTGTAAGVELAYLLGTANINLTGNGLDNAITGNSGDNVIDGGNGNDSISTGAGNDTLIGGAGNDTLSGGAGADTFVFAPGSGRDTITDFNTAEDKLDLNAYAGINTAAELSPYASNSGVNMVVNLGGGNVITINNMQVAQIHDGMFV
ncbi:MAG: calcium-binding protein [Hyphomicrobium sp.]|nr:calcium-binding protein [Hyphomicrobium sp.]